MQVHPFDTIEECEAALASLHLAMAEVARDHGLTVVDPFYVVGRNAATGEDEPGHLTTEWSPPIPLADGRWGIPSFRGSFPTSHSSLEAGLPPIEDINEFVQPDAAEGDGSE